MASERDLQPVIRLCKQLEIKVTVAPTLWGVMGPSLGIDHVQGLTVLDMSPPVLSRASRMAKRTMDIVGAGIALVLAAPALGIIALAIKLGDGGPVFFRQERVGRFGVPFRIHKFRTMSHAPAPQGPLITVGADARITRAGAFLRRHKLDELPQLIDVLHGRMSLVGPRPEVPRYVAMYPPGLRDKVLSVRPGITDPASLQFRDESGLLARAADPEREYVEVVMPAKLRLAAQYVERASLATDLQLIGRTVRLLFSHG
jgi:lipopolysaccharide/colanic/teichoic acid biosynthesis glycosyltransferase